MNSEDSIFDAQWLRLDLADKIYLRRGDMRVALSELMMFYTKASYINNKFEISGTTWGK